MRKALVAISILVASALIGIISRNCTPAHIDLREPIYLVIDQSFWYDCKYDPETEDVCVQDRIQAIKDGANDWFKHFDGATRPRVIIVYSEADVPFNPTNTPIYIKLKKDGCGLTSFNNIAAACYQDRDWSSPTIVFNAPHNITANTFAHELGHALGRDDNDTVEGVYSIMSYTYDPDKVLPIDIKILCQMHPECPPHEDTWCQDGFWDEDRCPSSSYEEGEIIFQAREAASFPVQ